jgi:DNA-binding CsgD family transcriptional regulator/PAS domain-containing protein
MYNLSKSNLEEVLKLVNFCMTHIKLGHIDPKDLLKEMLKTFRSYDAGFFPPNQSFTGVDLSNSFSIKTPEAEQAKYIDHYWRYDPLYSAQFTPEPINLVFKTDDVIPYSQLEKLDYYREYLQHINWFGELVIRLCTNDGFWGTISISRSPNQPYFDSTDVQKAEFLLPYLINTFEATTFFSKINEERKAFEQWLESRPEGIILLDAEMHPMFYNDKARQICGPLSGLKPRSICTYQHADITPPTIIIEDCKQLVDSHDYTSCFSHNRIINTANGERYYIKYTLINQPCDNIVLPYLIVHITNLSKNDDDMEAVLIKDYRLSEQEEKIAQYTGLGLTNKEIGGRLGISQFTVQSHLRNIFEKTGIKRRSQLANIIK